MRIEEISQIYKLWKNEKADQALKLILI